MLGKAGRWRPSSAQAAALITAGSLALCLQGGTLAPAVNITVVPTAHAASTAQLGDVDTFRLQLLKLKGHLGVARALLQLRKPGADYHLQQPFQEIFRTIEPELKARSAPLTEDVLTQLDRATEAPAQAALTMLDSAASAIDGSFARPGVLTPESALALSEALLRAAVDRYADSVENNEVVDLPAYQTGRGFVVQAEALVRHSTGLSDLPAHDALLASVVLIRQAWPSVIPPPIVFDPQSVSEKLDEAITAMDKLR